MAKNRLNDFDTTAANNSDVAGVGILGTNKPRNLDDAIRALMALLADWREGTSLNATAAFNDPTDASKTFAFSGANIPTSTDRDIDAEALYDFSQAATDILETAARRGAATVTAHTASGTHTFATTTNYYMIVAVGGGGGSGAVDGTGAGDGASTAGGNSGFYGRSAVLAKGALTTGTVVIGAAGAAGPSPAPVTAGGDGGDTTWADATVGTLTWKGGRGSAENTGTGPHAYGLPIANLSSSASLIGSYGLGGAGHTNATSDAGGFGGSNPWGVGGISTLAFGTAVNGVAGSGYGAGASGAASVGVTTNASGGAGTAGRLEVWEW